MFPFDQTYKLTAEEDSRGAISVVAGVPLPADAEVGCLDRELNLERQQVDHMYLIRTPQDTWILHFEALTHYRSDWVKAQLEHAVGIERKYALPVYSHLLLFQKEGTPEVVKTPVVRNRGGLTFQLEVNVIRLWERPASEVLHSDSVALLPWAALMDATVEEQREAARRLRDSGRDGLQMQMALLGALRYGSRRSFLERIGPMLLTKDILRESPMWQEIEKEARAEGLAKGIAQGVTEGMAQGIAQGVAEGQTAGERRALQKILSRRFGTLPSAIEQRIAAADLDTLERWIEQAIVADSLEASLR
ncbi:MAG: hypothetical protein JNK87_01375 [Bryobacterales bacterium]|nr:hypothetical protein [Bryobacterales bacterium]